MTVLENYAGHLAGVFASLLWMLTALSFTAGGHRIGTVAVNALRIFLGLVLLAATHAVVFGGLWPDATSKQVMLLAISGVVGLSIGDQALFTAFVYIGPRLGTLIMVTAPIFAAIFGRLFLDERLSPLAITGIAITIGGVAWVLLERRRIPEPAEAVPDALEIPDPQPAQASRDPRGARTRQGGRRPSLISVGKAGSDPKYRVLGIALAVVGSLCQAGGSLLSKQGMGHGWLEPDAHMQPLGASVIRMCFAALGVLPFLLWHAWQQRQRARRGSSPQSVDGHAERVAGAGDPLGLLAAEERRMQRRRLLLAGLVFTGLGTLTGPYLGMWMSLEAFDRAPLGIAQTLLSLTPIFILPVSVLVHHERLTLRAMVGALISIIGLSLLFLD